MWKFNLKYFLFITILFVLGCKDNETKINEFFEILENRLEGTEILKDIKSCKKDSMYEMLPILVSVYTTTNEDNIREKEWLNFVDSNFAKANYPIIDEILFLGFQKYLKNQKINLMEIQSEVKELKK
ncbi:MAG: hypothetical protein AB8G15_11045 [Saprospiraceae bacterium]